MPKAQCKEGLYYYYHVFAKALRAWGEPTLTDADGMTHDWRAELCGRLVELQNPDGSWVNEADRWYESNPALVTSYALLAMQAALQLGAAPQHS
jgi:squalene-hopene/tetraprenyl-beta-curcumene cyclase